MGPGEAVSTALSRYRRFTGRAERDEYFWFSLVGFLWCLLAQGIGLGLRTAPPGFALLIQLPLLLIEVTLVIPSPALAVRRLHDTGRSGHWVWLWLVPVLGALAVFVLNCFPGTDGDNRFGPPADAHHRGHRAHPSARDRSPWAALALSGTALGVVGVLLLAGLGAWTLVRPPRVAPAAAAAGGPGSTDGRSGVVTDPRPPAVRAVPVPPPVSAAPAICPPPSPTDPTAEATTTPHPAGTPDVGPIAPDDAGVSVTPDVGTPASSNFFAPLYEISGRGSRRVRVTLPDRKAGVEVRTDGPLQVWGVPAGSAATRASA